MACSAAVRLLVESGMPQSDVAELFETMAHLSRAAELNQAENKGEA